jgi:hypothetical protein
MSATFDCRGGGDDAVPGAGDVVLLPRMSASKSVLFCDDPLVGEAAGSSIKSNSRSCSEGLAALAFLPVVFLDFFSAAWPSTRDSSLI